MSGLRSRVTMADVAEHAGVSVATVSRALSGSRRMSPDLAETVLNSAEALGYQVNLLGRALRTQRTGTVGLLVPDLTNPYFTQLAEALSRSIAEGGMELLIASSRESTAVEERLIESLIGQQVDALLIIACDEVESTGHIANAATRIPTIQIDRRTASSSTHYIGTDDRLGFQLIAEHVAQVNVDDPRPVIFIGADLHVPSAQGRLDAFTHHFGDTVTYLGEYSFDWGARASEKILRSGITSAIIIGAADIIALGAMNTLQNSGYRVPEDFRIVGYDGVFSKLALQSMLTTVVQPVEEIAAQTWEVLHNNLARPTGAHKILMSPTLELGASSPH